LAVKVKDVRTVIRTTPSVDPARRANQAPFWLVAIAASAGGITALQAVLRTLPADLCAAIVIVQHRSPTAASLLERILARVSPLSVRTAVAGEVILPDHVYVARPDLHLVVERDHRFGYVDGTRVRGVRSSANPLLDSAARTFGNRAMAVVLIGSGLDATDGVQAIKASGGIVLVQDPASAQLPPAAVGNKD
jgi:two-component system, chemotaxis family, protein-glutamate methylesterase/glutaminase